MSNMPMRGRGQTDGWRRRMAPGEKAKDFKGTMKKLMAYIERI